MAVVFLSPPLTFKVIEVTVQFFLTAGGVHIRTNFYMNIVVGSICPNMEDEHLQHLVRVILEDRKSFHISNSIST